MWPLHRRNLSPEQPQQRGDVLMTNPWGRLHPSPSSNAVLCTLIFLPSHFKSEAAAALQTTRSRHCQAHRADKLTFVHAPTVTPRVSPSRPVSVSPCLPHTHSHTHIQIHKLPITLLKCGHLTRWSRTEACSRNNSLQSISRHLARCISLSSSAQD